MRQPRQGKRQARGQRWVAHVMATSDALDVPAGTFKRSAPEIARTLKRAAMRSKRRKADPYRSALSFLTFYINRGGRKLAASRRRTLEQAKRELRRLFGKPEPKRPRRAA